MIVRLSNKFPGEHAVGVSISTGIPNKTEQSHCQRGDFVKPLIAKRVKYAFTVAGYECSQGTPCIVVRQKLVSWKTTASLSHNTV